MHFKNLKECLIYFKEESVCREYLIQQRWNGNPVCPFCQNTKIYSIENGKRFKCAIKTCNKKFSVTVGTIFENTKISLSTWFAAIYLCTSSKKGISSLQLHRQLGITQKTAWFVLHRVREMLKDKAPDMLKDVVQVDETYVGGKNKNRHADKKIPNSQGRSLKDKTPVIAVRSLKGNITTQVIPDTQAETITPIIEKWVEKGSIMVSDEWHGYNGIKKDYFHIVVNHSDGEYVRGAFTSNGVENFWSLFKRGIYGIYHQVSAKHLQRYCDEFAARYNTRLIKDNQRFELTIQNVSGRLKYIDLICKGNGNK